MGGAVIRAAQQSLNIKLVGAIDKPGSRRIGKDAGEISGAGTIGVALSDQIVPAFKSDSVIIDFTNPEASLGYLKAAAKLHIPIVIATTGFDAKQLSCHQTAFPANSDITVGEHQFGDQCLGCAFRQSGQDAWRRLRRGDRRSASSF